MFRASYWHSKTITHSTHIKMNKKPINSMLEFTKTNYITFSVIGVLLVIILGFILLNPAKYTFTTQLSKELSDIQLTENQVAPQSVAQAMLKKDTQIVLVDVRSQFDFAKGHLPDAVNIYKVNLMNDKNVDFFKDLKQGNKKAVLYGNSAAEANVPFMILKQMGIENIGYLTVGYEELKANNWAEIAANTTKFNDEIPVVDFAKFILDANKSNNSGQNVANKPAESKPAPKVVVKPAASGGGDEGC